MRAFYYLCKSAKHSRNILETFSIDGDTETWDFIEGGEMPNSED